MARNNGPVKGIITLICSDSAETSMYIAEPITVTHAQFLSLEGGTLEVSATIATDDVGVIKYFAPTVTTVGTPVVTGTRRGGAAKGILVFVNNTDAASSSYILEPMIANQSDYDAVKAGTKHLQATMFTDSLGHMFFEATIK